MKTEVKTQRPKKKRPVAPKGYNSLAVDSLIKAPWNYKTDDPDMTKKLVSSIKRHGQVQNIIVREMGGGLFEVVNGNHRLDAFIQLGMSTAMCFNLGKIPEALAKRIALETNEINFDPDPFRLGEVIGDLLGEFEKSDLLETLPYTSEDIDAMTSIGAFSPGTTSERPPKEDLPTTGEVPVSRVLDAVGISTMPAEEVDALVFSLMGEIERKKIEKKERWKALMR